MPSKPSGRKRFPPLVTLAIVVLLILFWVVQGLSVMKWAAKHDVLSFYTGASFAVEGRWAELYDPAEQLEFQRRLFPEINDIAPYIRPNYYAALLSPWGAIPYPAAFWVWIGLHSVLLIGCWYWAGRRFHWDAMIWGAMFFPTFAGVSNGQDCVWILLIALAAFSLGERNRELAAGAVFGLALIKFNLLVLLPLAMLAGKRWRMLAGYTATVAGIALVFLALDGAASLGAYRDLITNPDIRWLEPNPNRMINLASIGANLGLPLVLVYAASGLTGILALWSARKAPLWLWLSLAMIGSVLINPHAYSYDGAMLLLPLWLVLYLSEDAASRAIAAMVAIPLPFYTLLIGTPWCVIPAILLTALFVSLLRLALRPRTEPVAVSPPVPATS